MKTLFYLGNCGTCQRIIADWQPLEGIEMREIKSEAITEAEIDAMQRLAGSYEALFSRVALKYRAMKLNEQQLEEADYRRLILEEYTFLKRPVLLLDQKIFIGNTAKNVAAAKAALHP